MFRWLICTLIMVTSALAQEPADAKLKMAVIVTRHGVRPPLSPNTTSPYARDPWPTLEQWGARCPGDLTKTGFKLATLMGAYYSEYFIQKGLLTDPCPHEQVYIWADNEERTEETAAALAKGLAHGMAGCTIRVKSLGYTPPNDKCESQSKDPTDYFFHPLADTELPKLDPNKMQAIADAINSSLPALHLQYAPELAALQKVLICCDASLCPTPPCTLPTLPDQANPDPKSNKLAWQGPFTQGSTATENLLLEYANGMPCSTLGWERVAYHYTPDCKPPGGQPFKRMHKIHTLYFEKNQQSFYIAQTQGSNLANQVLEKLQAGMAGQQQPLVIYAGHDTNLANLAGLLNLSWDFTDLPDNDTPPAGALVFELYESKKGEFSLKIRFVHATMAQMRTQAVLSLSNPPEWSEVTIHDCNNPCSFSKFQAIMKKVIDKNYIAPNPPAKLTPP